MEVTKPKDQEWERDNNYLRPNPNVNSAQMNVVGVNSWGGSQC